MLLLLFLISSTNLFAVVAKIVFVFIKTFLKLMLIIISCCLNKAIASKLALKAFKKGSKKIKLVKGSKSLKLKAFKAQKTSN